MIAGLAPDLERILEAGNQAPSGENCQPWHFVVKGDRIEVKLLPDRDQSAYSWGQRASYLACGAAIENMAIAATEVGHRVDVDYLPNPKDPNVVASLSIIRNAVLTPDPLAGFIFKRMSNRKAFKKEPLGDEIKQKLFHSHTPLMTEDPQEIERLGRVGSTNEEVMLGNKGLHRFFFSHVTWSEEEDQEKKIGFFIKTLELPPPAQVMFRIIQKWWVMRIFRAVGFPKVVATQNAATNAAASAIVAFPIDATTRLDFIKIGRAVERFWLNATSIGLSLQPLTGILFFKLKIDAEGRGDFSVREQHLIQDAYKTASTIFKTGGRHIAFMCRIGKGEPPSAHAVRFPLVEAVTVKA